MGTLPLELCERLIEQIKKRRLVEKSFEEQKQICLRAQRLWDDEGRPTIDQPPQEFMEELGYYLPFWLEIGVPFDQADKHYGIVRAAAASIFIENRYK